MPVDQMETDRVMKEIRACLTAVKSGLSLEVLNSTYNDMVGKPIPYRALGFTSLTEMLAAGRDFCTVSNSPSGMVVVHAKVTKESLHIRNLVRCQATKSKRRRGGKKKNIVKQPVVIQHQPLRSLLVISAPGGNHDVRKLREFCSTQHLVLEKFETSFLGNKNFMASVVVGQDRFWTYPYEYSSKEAAENAVSKLALDALKNSGVKKNVELKSSVTTRMASPNLTNSENSDQNFNSLMVERIQELVGEKIQGLWSTKIQVDYQRKFKTDLPLNWISKLKEWPNAKMKVDSPVDGRYIVLPDKSTEVSSPSKQMELPMLPLSKLNSSVEVPKLLKKFELPKELGIPYVPSAGSYFDVSVTLAASPNNFMVISLDNEEKLTALQNEMNLFYDNPSNWRKMTMSELSEDNFFALKHLIDDSWYRVKVNSVVSEEIVTVQFVDFGDVTVANLKHIQRLNNCFRDLPMQAIKATLRDVIPINGTWTSQERAWFSNRVLKRRFVSCIKNVCRDHEDGMVKIEVSLVDTTNPDTDIYIDQELIRVNRSAVVQY